MKLAQPKKSRLYEDVVNQIIKKINSGELKPGDRLPSERELSNDLGISRNSVREAFRTLEMRGNVEIRHGDGVFVKQINLEKMLKPYTDIISDDDHLIIDLLEVRDHLEVEIVKLATMNAEPDEIQVMCDILGEAEKSMIAGDDGVVYDDRFHMALARATHNRIYILIINMIQESLTSSKKVTESVPGQKERTLKDHQAILKGIQNGDVEEAIYAMKKHLKMAKENFLSAISERN